MWYIHDKIEYRDDLVSKRTGSKYGAWVISGTKKGFQDTPDEPYERKFFDSSTATIIEKGVERPNLSVVQFFQKAVKPGDTIKIKYVRRGNGWDIDTMENISGQAPTYEPLPDDYVPPKPEYVSPPQYTTTTPPWAQ